MFGVDRDLQVPESIDSCLGNSCSGHLDPSSLPRSEFNNND